MTGYYNVKDDFGAAGDGCADDTEAIQSAVDALRRGDATPVSCKPDPIEPDSVPSTPG